MYIWPDVAFSAEQVKLVTQNPFGLFRRRVRVAYSLPVPTAAADTDELPTLVDGVPEAELFPFGASELPEEEFPTLVDGEPTAVLSGFSAAEPEEDELPTLVDGVPTAELQPVAGDNPLLLITSFLDNEFEHSSDIPINHPSWSYRPELVA